MMSLNRELAWICNLLSENEVKFWVDSGTLLGLVREGGIMKGDHDIDLSMWSADEPFLQKVLPAVKSRGYKIAVRNYRGLNFKYKFMPRFKGSSLEIDISLFRRVGDYAWCPQVYCMPYPFAKKTPAYYLYALPRRIIQEIFIRRRRVALQKWPWTLSYKVYMLWVPGRFYEDTIIINDGIPAPKAYEDYLAFRYGQWKVPQKDWFFIFDDGAIRHTSPEELISDLGQ